MRQLLCLSLLFFACAAPALSQETSDREQRGFKGLVKTVRTKSEGLAQAMSAPGKVVPEINQETTFDRDGRKVEEARYEPDGKLYRRSVFTYDDGVKTEESYKPDGTLRHRIITKKEFDKARGTSRTMVTGEMIGDGKFYSEMVNKYDSQGRLVEGSSFDREGKLQGRSVWRYGAGGGIEEFVYYDGAGAVRRRTVWIPEGARTFVYGDDGALVSTETQRRQVCEESDQYGNCKRATTAQSINRGGKVEEFTVVTTYTFTYH